MADNKILPWAAGSDPNVMSDTDYAAALAAGGTYANGVESGQASSAQANKTWKQSAAVSSGVAQFLTDNLSVDVTDADTAATFSDRIANAILKLSQISPFNSSFATATGGYKKYAIVSDSSGNFWVSTADSNLTTPGAEGASWQSLFNGYATESWANDTFVGKAEGDQDYSPLQAGVNKTSGEIWLSYTNSSGTVEYVFAQIAGDYALQTALTAEVTRAEAAEETLTNDKVNRSSDTMTGALTVSEHFGSDTSGQLRWGGYLNSTITGATWNNFQLYMCELVEQYAYADLQVNYHDGSGNVARADFLFRCDTGRIHAPAGIMAVESDLPTSGTLTGTGSVITGYWTKTAGILRQTFTIEVSPDSDGNATVTFPKAFSEVPTVQATGSVELQQVHTGGAANQSSSTALKNTTTQALLHFWTGSDTSSVVPSIVTITAEGPA